MFKGVASRALGVFALFTVVCGLGYTLVVTGIAQVAFPYQANGSLIKVDGKVVGSELIGQNFDDEAHMWGSYPERVNCRRRRRRAYGVWCSVQPVPGE